MFGDLARARETFLHEVLGDGYVIVEGIVLFRPFAFPLPPVASLHAPAHVGAVRPLRVPTDPHAGHRRE